jgi:4-hydroxy-4-methyl-2-oxoglutarate aldolase
MESWTWTGWLASIVYSAVVSDSCDRSGLRHQTASPGLCSMSVPTTVVGWARTVRAVPVFEPPVRHYGREIDFIDSLRPGDVVVADTSGANVAFWGSSSPRRRPVAAQAARSSTALSETGRRSWPSDFRYTRRMFDRRTAWADSPSSSRTFRCCSAASQQRRDLVVADADGIVVVPHDEVASVLEYTVKKASVEDDVRQMLLAGGKVADVWEKYRVL